jgi:hypothetical protein
LSKEGAAPPFKQIVEMHGGTRLGLVALGKGVTFQMELPTRAELRQSAP